MNSRTIRDVVHVAVGVVVVAAVLQTWLVLGWIVPVTVSGSSMAPALLGPHRLYRCNGCQAEFAVGLDQLPLGEYAMCTHCGQRRTTAAASPDRRGERIAVDRTAFAWREPHRWEVVVFRCPENASDLCVKRVVGLPGETISLDGGDVLIDGQVVRKSLAEQLVMRLPVDITGEVNDVRTMQVGDVQCRTSSHWLRNDSTQLDYHPVHDEAISDEFNCNQGVTPPANRVTDVMLTFDARLAGAGKLVLKAATDAGRCNVTVDFSQGEITLRRDGRTAARRPLTAAKAGLGRSSEWTFSLFDRQVLLAIGNDVLLAEPWERDKQPSGELVPPLAIGFRGLKGEIRRLAVWRDVFYALRHGDGRQVGAERDGAATWRLGSGEFFVLGDNAAISDDSRSWPAGPGLDAKLLIGKPLGVR
ncbi:MAG: signal peptidase I [Pirellulales bacterium]